MGSETNYFNLPGLQEHALGMKSLGDAFLLRNQLIDLFEEADFECCADEREPLLTVVVAGGGFSGVETMGAINDFMRTAVKSYPHLHEDHLRLVLVHPGDDTLLPELGKKLGEYAQKKLSERKVEIMLNTRVTGMFGRLSAAQQRQDNSDEYAWCGPLGPLHRRFWPRCLARKSAGKSW